MDIELQDLTKKADDQQELYDLFSELEFKTWIKELEESGISGTSKIASKQKTLAKESQNPVSVTPKETVYETVTNFRQLGKLVETISSLKSKKISINLELEQEHFLNAQIVGIGISTDPGNASYIPLTHDYDDAPEQLDSDEAIAALKPVLENGDIVKLGYDLKHISHVLKNHEIELVPLKSDVLLASYVLNSIAVKHKLEDIARFYLDTNLVELEKLLGKGRNKLTVKQVPIEKFAEYAAERADYIYRLASFLEQELAGNGHLLGLYHHYELPLIEVLQHI